MMYGWPLALVMAIGVLRRMNSMLVDSLRSCALVGISETPADRAELVRVTLPTRRLRAKLNTILFSRHQVDLSQLTTVHRPGYTHATRATLLA